MGQPLQRFCSIIVFSPNTGYHFAGAAVDLGHPLDLMLPLLEVPLVNAYYIYPQDTRFIG